MLKFITGFCTATLLALAVFILRDEIYDTSDTLSATNTFDPLVQIAQHEGAFPHYRLGLGSYFHNDPNYYPTFGPFRLVHLEPALEIKPSDIEKVCFSGLYQNEEGILTQLQINITLSEPLRTELTSELTRLEGEELSFEIGPFKISNVRPNGTSVKEHIEAMAFRNTNKDFGPEKHPDFSLSSYDSVPALMHVASALSPEKMPEVCDPFVNIEDIKQWEEITQYYWGETKRYL